jgi:thioredoxin domain-containing protein 5
MNAPHSPLVVLTAVPKADAPGHDGAVSQVKEVARQWRAEASKYPGQYVQFVWMDANRWASWLKSQYGIKSSNLPATILVKHKVCFFPFVTNAVTHLP